MKVIIAGPRTFTDYSMVQTKCDNILARLDRVVIVSGACSDKKNGILTFIRPDGTKVYGADGLGERYAAERGYPVEAHPARWDLYGLPAGPIRNAEMARTANACIVFWDGISKGTRGMKELAEQHGLLLREIRY